MQARVAAYAEQLVAETAAAVADCRCVELWQVDPSLEERRRNVGSKPAAADAATETGAATVTETESETSRAAADAAKDQDIANTVEVLSRAKRHREEEKLVLQDRLREAHEALEVERRQVCARAFVRACVRACVCVLCVVGWW
jgi:hypothetical protein